MGILLWSAQYPNRGTWWTPYGTGLKIPGACGWSALVVLLLFSVLVIEPFEYWLTSWFLVLSRQREYFFICRLFFNILSSFLLPQYSYFLTKSDEPDFSSALYLYLGNMKPKHQSNLRAVLLATGWRESGPRYFRKFLNVASFDNFPKSLIMTTLMSTFYFKLFPEWLR